jgi:tripartite-type tricarboxylate transporter receptor subunit TctC
MKVRNKDSNGYRRREFLIGAAAASSFLVVRPWNARAAKWPEKPITLVIMYAPGGGTDVVLRVIAKEMAAAKGWTIEPVSKPGAVGGIATNYVLQQPADGYTVLGAANFNKFVRVMGHTTSKPWEDWTFLQAASSLASWSVAKNSQFKSVKDVVEFAKANPGRLTVSTSGTGGIWHEVAMQVGDALGVRPKFVPYKGGKPATLAGLQGETMISGGGVHEHIDLIRDGQLRNLFHCGTSDIKLKDGTILPSIANFAPQVKPLLPMGGQYNFVLKRDTPVEALKEIQAAFKAAVNTQAFKEVAEKQYFEIEYVAGEAADKKAARLEATTAKLFNQYKDQIGAPVKTAQELGLPDPAKFDSWWPPKDYKPIKL